jgi:hypothetical protein
LNSQQNNLDNFRFYGMTFLGDHYHE